MSSKDWKQFTVRLLIVFGVLLGIWLWISLLHASYE